jgi:hypothetical protein
MVIGEGVAVYLYTGVVAARDGAAAVVRSDSNFFDF